jgi:hypothetical protein
VSKIIMLQTTPTPKDDNIHLCPFEAIKSIPKSLTLKYNVPSDA